MTNITTQPQQQLTAKSLFSREDIKGKFQELLGKRSSAFMTSVLQIVSSNDLLKNADPMSVFQAAATAATLDLPINNNLGFAYIVPYQSKNGTQAQFQMGYKGFIQLALRSGQFLTISSCPVYDGQLVEENPLTGFVFDFTKKKSDNIVGYAAYFKLLNGFEKTLFMTLAQVKQHGKKYSKTFDKQFSVWNNDFDGMAQKTVIKLLLSKFAPLSIEMQRAIITDQSIIKDSDTMEVQYVDNEPEIIDKEAERIAEYLSGRVTKSEVEEVRAEIDPKYTDLIEARLTQIENEG